MSDSMEENRTAEEPVIFIGKRTTLCPWFNSALTSMNKENATPLVCLFVRVLQRAKPANDLRYHKNQHNHMNHSSDSLPEIVRTMIMMINHDSFSC